MRPTKQELLERMMKRTTAPAPEPTIPQDPEIQTAFVEVQMTRHPLQCWTWTIYDQISTR